MMEYVNCAVKKTRIQTMNITDRTFTFIIALSCFAESDSDWDIEILINQKILKF